MTIMSGDVLTEVKELCEQIIAAHSTADALIGELDRAGLLDLQLLELEGSEAAESVGPATSVGAAASSPVASSPVDSVGSAASRSAASRPAASRPAASGAAASVGAAASRPAASRPAATAVIAALAAAGVEVPAVEHLWIAGHLLRTAGLPTPNGVMTAAFADELGVDHLGEELILTGTLTDVPYLDVADLLVLLTAEGTLAHVPRAALDIDRTRTLGAMRFSNAHLGEVRVPAGNHVPTTLTGGDLRDRAAVGRLLQIRAAAERATELTVDHVSSRVQFGRPLRKFQAVQNRLSACLGEAIMLGIGTDLALAGRSADIALARIDARRSVTVIREQTHQLHGAMGVTAEYPLGRLNATMLAWLAATGPDRAWVDRAGEHIATHGAWPTITGEEDET